MTLADRDERGATAGEYVLGTLSAADREAFARELLTDRALLSEVYFWQDRLLPLTNHAPRQVPRRDLWPLIESALTPVADSVHAAQGKAAEPAANDPVWRQLQRWKWIGSCAVAASAVLATVLGLQLLAPPAGLPTRYLAVLQAPQDNSTGWLVEVTQGERVRLIPVGTMAPVPVGKALQFWTKAQGAAGPTSLGLVAAGHTLELPAALLPALGEKQLFEVTLEPEGGSPLNRPTGPVLYLGRTLKL